jgi:hypothetical protein
MKTRRAPCKDASRLCEKDKTAARRRRGHVAAGRRPVFERLEPRTLLSGNAVVEVFYEFDPVSAAATTPPSQTTGPLTAGQDYTLRAYIQDIRAEPEGVQQAYLNVTYNTSVVTLVAGTYQPSPEFSSAQYVQTQTAGIISQAGGVNSTDVSPQPEAELLFQVEVQISQNVSSSAITLGTSLTGNPDTAIELLPPQGGSVSNISEIEINDLSTTLNGSTWQSTIPVEAVNQAPAITSAASTTFSVGISDTFKVTTSGYPTPSITETGPLPNGVSFTDNGDGTATLAGIPSTGTANSYPITITASNGVGSNAQQDPFTLTVDPPPTISTAVSAASVVVGGTTSDTATVSGGDSPTGTVTFNLYNNATGTGPALFTDANQPLVDGAASSGSYTTTAAGTDYWVATYSGDVNNLSVASGLAAEPVAVKATPAISTTTVPATSVVVGGTTADTATVSGGDSPTGTVTFKLYNNATGTGTPLFTDADEPLAGGAASSKSYTTTAAGTDYWVATYNGDGNNVSVASGAAAEPVAVEATPTISTTVSATSIVVGGTTSDKATVSGGDSPTGTVTFNLYNNATGTGPALFTDANQPLAGGVASSTSYTTTAAGTEYWVATYNGDVNNVSVASGAAAEPVTVKATPAISTTTVPATSIVVGGTTSDTATVSGGDSPTGTVTFKLYNNATGTGTPLFTDANQPLAGGAASSTSYTTTAAGTDYWVATYNGDVNNVSVASDLAAEPVTVKATPVINTTASPDSVAVGSTTSDKATVSGGDSPTGTVTFNLYDNATATGPALFTDADVPLAGGAASSTNYTTTVTGTDYWVATYNGDGNNIIVASGLAAEPVTVGKATPAISTTVSAGSVAVGGMISDTATVSLGDSPTGTVTFNLYDNATGTGTPLFTDADERLSGGAASSKSYTTTGPGTDYWVATYNGDVNNVIVASGLAAEPVTVKVGTPAINTTVSAGSIVVGSTISDTATVTGGDSPTGTVTFNLYNNATGTGTPLFTDANEPLAGGGASSKNYTTTAAGTDYWVATYNGDVNNLSAASGLAAEPVTVSMATSSAINTTVSAASVVVGHTTSDTATVSGGYNPTGTVTFNLYDNATATGPALFTDANQPLSAGTASSTSYTTTAIGTDYWVATYNGDGNNVSATSGLAAEPVTVNPPPLAINTTVSAASIVAGSATSDTATVSGGDSPTGTVTFNLYNNATGTGPALFTDANETLSGGVASSKPYTTTATGTDYWVATYNGDGNNGSVTSGVAAEPVTVGKATPAISTTTVPVGSIVVGNTTSDTATVSGGYSPTGTVTFNLYNNATATGPALFTDTEPLAGGAANSASYTATAAGTDYWVATYSGDGNNVSVVSGLAKEPVTVSKATPVISTTTVPAISIVVGGTTSDTATVVGGDSPTGTVTFKLYDNATATGTPLFTDANESLSGGAASSTSYTTTAAGTDYWVATYNGDGNNLSVASLAAAEPVTVGKVTPAAINTTVSAANIVVGGTTSDTATVVGGDSPTGTVTFNLFNNATATGPALFTDTETLSGGAASSKNYTTTATGTDYWVATYNGDGNNVSLASGVAAEAVTVGTATPVISTTVSAGIVGVGSTTSDTATVSGGYSPTGTVTFNLYNNATGTGPALFTDADEPLSGGAASSKSYTATATGTDYWVATYNGDVNNLSVASGVAAEPVTVSVANASLSGYVYDDANNNGQREISAGVYKLGIPDVTMTLEPSGATALTQIDGSYQFNSLPAGTYTIVETQPQQYLPGGKDTPGSLGGQGSTADTISQIVLGAGQNGTEYDFGEYLLAPGILSKRIALASTPTTQDLVDQQILDPPPVVQLGGSTTDYTTSSVGGGAVSIGPSATITHAGGDLASLTVTIANLKDGSSEELFIPGQTIGAVAQSLIAPLSTKISAAYAAGVLTLTGVDSVGDYQSVLNSIEWDDTALPSPNPSTRYITVVADDAIAASNTATTTITDPPAPAKTNQVQAFAANQVHAAVVSKTTVAHVATTVASKSSNASLTDRVLESVYHWLGR